MGHWESAGLPDEFDNVVRLLPLPNMVLFPHVVQALHIFEPRYCDMLSEALESDHLITMALLEPGWESSLEDSPVISPIVCIGRIVSHTPTDDGRHNILLAGIKRARIIKELHVETPFRQAIVEVLEDIVPELNDYQVNLYRDNLLSVFRSFIPQDASGPKSFGELLTRQLPLGILIDIVAYAVSLPSDVKLAILSELDIVSRYELLMEHIGGHQPTNPNASSSSNAQRSESTSSVDISNESTKPSQPKLDTDKPIWPKGQLGEEGDFPPRFSTN